MPELETEIKQAAAKIITRLSDCLSGPELEAAGRLIVEELADYFRAAKNAEPAAELLKTCRLFDRAGFFPGKSGNVSLRLTDSTFLITPSGVRKSELAPEDLVEMDLAGRVLRQDKKPSSEAKMHCHVYQKRQEIKAVVHAHPPFATGFAAAGLPLDTPVLPEAILVLGRVPLAAYGTPGTWEVPESLTPYLERGDNAFLLSNHGALTIGETLDQAAHLMETLELFAQVLLISRLLGGEKLLSREDLEKLSRTHPQPH